MKQISDVSDVSNISGAAAAAAASSASGCDGQLPASLPQLCASLLTYQQGMEAMDACLADFLSLLDALRQDLRRDDTRSRFEAAEGAVTRLTQQVEQCAASLAAIRQHQAGLAESFPKIEELRDAMQHFGQAMERFQQQTNNLNRKLYNRDFQAILKSMNERAADSRSQGTYAYRHMTSQDYDILTYEYQAILGQTTEDPDEENRGEAPEHQLPQQDPQEPGEGHEEKDGEDEKDVTPDRWANLQAFLQAAGRLLEDTPLTQQEYEALQRLVEKLVHSHHEARSRFLADCLATGKASQGKEDSTHIINE